jgi:hypothetical protein
MAAWLMRFIPLLLLIKQTINIEHIVVSDLFHVVYSPLCRRQAKTRNYDLMGALSSSALWAASRNLKIKWRSKQTTQHKSPTMKYFIIMIYNIKNIKMEIFDYSTFCRKDIYVI